MDPTNLCEIITRSQTNKRRRSLDDEMEFNKVEETSNTVMTSTRSKAKQMFDTGDQASAQLHKDNVFIESFIQSWKCVDKNTFQVKNDSRIIKYLYIFIIDLLICLIKNEIKECKNELTKQHNLAQKLLDLYRQLDNLLKSSTVCMNY